MEPEIIEKAIAVISDSIVDIGMNELAVHDAPELDVEDPYVTPRPEMIPVKLEIVREWRNAMARYIEYLDLKMKRHQESKVELTAVREALASELEAVKKKRAAEKTAEEEAAKKPKPATPVPAAPVVAALAKK
jgi:hypothetical protein